MMTKVKVSGKEADPFFRWLITRPGSGAVSWNFNKFLIGRDGTTIRKFGSSTAPNDKELMNAIDTALAKP
jgi:glutathione peroxidase